MNCDRKIGPYPCCSVVQGDCLELMKQLPDGCVDAVITDPPYIGIKGETVHKLGGVGRHFQRSKTVGDRWSANLDWFPLVARVSTKAIAAFCSYTFVSELRMVAAEIDIEPVALVTWYKRNTPLAVANVPRFTSEFIWLFRVGPNANWKCLDTTVLDIPNINAGCVSTGERLTNDDGTVVHPTQKPLALMERLVAIAPDTILDPFCGSGTTLVAAKKLGRHFLGFEISEEYCLVARERLDRIDAQPSLFEKKPEQMKLG